MPEIIQVALATFFYLSVVFALVYGMYRLIRFAVSRLPEGCIGGSKEETWDGAKMIYSLPSSIIGFIWTPAQCRRQCRQTQTVRCR